MFYEPATQTKFNSIEEFRLANPHVSFGDPDSAGLFYLYSADDQYDFELQELGNEFIVFEDGKWKLKHAIVSRQLSHTELLQIMKRRFDTALTRHLDSVAQADNWDNRINFAVRAGYPNIWQQKAIAFGTWMDNCNAIAYQFQAEVDNGTRPMPSSVQEFISSLPVFSYVPS